MSTTVDAKQPTPEMSAYMHELAERCKRLLDQYKDDQTPWAVAYRKHLEDILSGAIRSDQ